MDVDTRLLRYFAAVAAEGSLSRAAERLFVSQPALTKQIKQLEGQLGVQLFTRSRAGMTLTAAGQALADRIPFRQLWDEPFVAAPAETGLWREYHLAAAERQGHPVRIGAVTDQPDAYLTAIANGDGIALVPESASRYYARPGITYRPVTGVSPSQVGVAWSPANDSNPVVEDFVRCCLDNKPAT